MSIQALPPDVIAQIRSSITVTNLSGVVFELVKNALDADASNIEITLDYSRGSCSVEDNGVGILPSEFGVDGHLGRLYHTSKLNAQTEVHGGRGIFLASLSAMALVSVTSHHHLHRSHNALTLHKSEVVSRQTPAPQQQHLVSHHGTRVTVRDLFGNMPVRVKQRALIAEKVRGNSKDWEMLKRDVVSLLLPWPRTVAVTARDSQTSHKFSVRPTSMPFQSGSGEISISSVCSILARASFVSHNEKSSWISVHASTPSVDVGGTISLDPAATKHIQFLSIGIQPIVSSNSQSVFHDEINRLFANSVFGIEEAEEIDMVEQGRRAKDGLYKGSGYTGKELKGLRKGVERWPMFFIRIRVSQVGNSKSLSEDVFDEKGQSLVMILEVLRVMILEFLTKNHFRPKAGRGSPSKKVIDVGPPANSSPGTTTSPSVLPRLNDPSRRRAKNSSLKPKHCSDPLGTNIRLPSFRQDISCAESPFDSWSRVKKGTPKAMVEEPDVSQSQILRPATAPTGIPPTDKASVHRVPRKVSLLSKDGKITRAPFEDVDLPARPSPPPPRASPLAPRPAPASEDTDEIMDWVNPVTKVKSFINKRTGLVTIPPTNAAKIFSHASHQPRLTTPRPWINDILKKWDNPTYAPAEPSIPQISFDGSDANSQNILHGHHHHCSQLDIDRAFKESSGGTNARISKDALRHAEVVSQVDQKFILAKLQSTGHSTSELGGGIMLVLIDQHAADERIRVEALMEELCSPPLADSTTVTESGILTTSLAKALHLDLAAKEIHLLQIHQSHFTNWGILYTISPASSASSVQCLTIHSLPPSILERCQTSPRLLIDLIRTELWKFHDKHAAPAAPLPPGNWLQRIHSCPQGLLDMINSRACRSAIMFNDVLSKAQCATLVGRLSECKFPFQCAHGRPTLVPLVDLVGLRLGDSGIEEEEKEGGFAGMFRRWREGMEPREN